MVTVLISVFRLSHDPIDFMEVNLKAMALRRFSVTAMLKWSHWISTLNFELRAVSMVFVHSLDFYLSESSYYLFLYLFWKGALWYYHIIYHHVYIMFTYGFHMVSISFFEVRQLTIHRFVNASGLWMHPHGASGRERSVVPMVQRFHRILI